MAENYLQKATQIYMGFDAESSREWLRKNGMTELAKMLLDDMADARSEDDYKKAEYQFKNRIVVPFFKEYVYPRGEKAVKAFVAENPIINVAPPKSVGSYDDLKKNQAFSDSKYAQAYTDEKGNRVVNVPLLQIANDPEELSLAALRLGITPEDLHDHIVNEWRRKKEKEWPEIEASMKKEMLANRGKVVKEYDKNFWSGVLRTVAPELYAGMRRDIAEGKGEAGSVGGWLGEHKKDVALDAVRSGAVATIPSITSNPIVTGIGVGTAGIASLAGSSYYPFNSDNVKTELMAGLAAGTIPSGVGMVLSKLSAAGAGWRQAARKAMRAIQRGEDLPSVNEQNLINKSVDDAYFIYEAYRNGDYSKTGEQVRTAIQKVYDMLNKSPRTVGKDIPLGDVEKMLTSKEGVMEIKSLLQAPSKKTFVNWNAIAENGQFFSEADYKAAKEAVRRTDELFPETFSEITAPEIAGTKQKIKDVAAITIGNAAEKYGSYAEPMRQRRDLKEGLSPYEADHPEQVEAWKRYGIPSWDPLADEFKEKYGEGK
jgi:hypothetical protein